METGWGASPYGSTVSSADALAAQGIRKTHVQVREERIRDIVKTSIARLSANCTNREVTGARCPRLTHLGSWPVKTNGSVHYARNNGLIQSCQGGDPGPGPIPEEPSGLPLLPCLIFIHALGRDAFLHPDEVISGCFETFVAYSEGFFILAEFCQALRKKEIRLREQLFLVLVKIAVSLFDTRFFVFAATDGLLENRRGLLIGLFRSHAKPVVIVEEMPAQRGTDLECPWVRF